MKPSVLFIMHYPPPVHGASMMGKYIYESSTIKNNFQADFINLSLSKKLNEIGRSGFGKAAGLLSLQWKVAKALFKKRYDLCYITLTASNVGFYKDLLVIFMLKLFNKKIVYHFHNKGVAAAGHNKLNNYLYKYVFRNTNTILLSPLVYDDIKKYTKQSNIFYCNNGIPVNPEVFSKTEAVKDKCRLLFLSNMMEEKGVFVLLNACKQLKAKNCSFECHFIGAWFDITEKEFYQQVEEEGLEDCVFAHGPKYGNEKSKFLDSTDIFLFPTYYHNEVFPLVNLEAMQYGIPVVSTFEGAIPDIVVDNVTGFLVPQRNAELLADRLEVLIQNPSLRLKMGAAGKIRFNTLFTLNQFEKNFTSILKKILNTDPVQLENNNSKLAAI